MENRVKKKLSSPFLRFVCRKLLFMVIATFISMTFVFLLPRLMPSNPADIMVARIATGGGTTTLGVSGQGATTTGGLSSLEVMRKIYMEKFGVNEPLTSQFMLFWKRFFTLDFGPSYYKYPESVTKLVIYALPWTLCLVIPVLITGFFVGNLLGSKSAFYRRKIDSFLYYFTMIMWRAPYYWFALLFIFFLGIELKLFPVWGGYSTRWLHPVLSVEWFLDAAYHYILPFLSLVGLGIGGWAVGMRAMVIYELGSDYINFAYALGFGRKKLRKYAERNAILPNFTWLPITFSALISQTLLVEVVFGYPGLGTLLYNAVLAIDYPLIEATCMITILIVLVGNFICDILYGKLDPRIGSGYVEES